MKSFTPIPTFAASAGASGASSPALRSKSMLRRNHSTDLRLTPFFVPFTQERDHLGRLLPPGDVEVLVTTRSPTLTQRPQRKHNAAFLRTVQVTQPRLKKKRFDSPCVGTYNPSVSRPVVHKRTSSFVTGRQPLKAVGPRTTDLLDYDAVYNSLDRHVMGVDMTKSLARGKTEELSTKGLLGPSITLPPHLAKFKGFYHASGLKQGEAPELKAVAALRKTALEKLEDLKQAKRDMLTKLMFF